MHDLVHLAVGRGGGVDGSGIVIDHQRLHLQLLRRKNDARLAIGSELVDTRRRSGRGIGVALVVGSNVPQIGGRRGVERAERRGQREIAIAADGDAVRCALLEVVVLGLFPGARGLRPADCSQQRAQERQSKNFHHVPDSADWQGIRRAYHS